MRPSTQGRACVVIALLTVGGVSVAAQVAKQTFEVASVKRNVSGAPGPGGGPTATTMARPGGVYTATNVTLEQLILNSYRTPDGRPLREDQLLGGPAWVRSDRFDIEARAGSDVPRDQMSLMLQALLEERFRLVLRKEQQDRETYVLTMARSDGRLGPDLHQRSETDCAPQPDEDPLAFSLRRLQTLPKPSGGGRPWFAVSCSTIADLASGALTRQLRTTVIDKTGLTGKWTIVVAYPSESANPDPVAARDPNPTGSLFTAVQDSLGLRLVKQRGNVDVMVIDSAQQPSEN
jgi:uncharacterized protein (TIGR03435 family)